MMSFCFQAIVLACLCNFAIEPSDHELTESLTANSIEDAQESLIGSEEDNVNKLPDAVLSSIISFLPIHQAVRTSILSGRWKPIWRWSNHIFIDQKYLFSSKFQHFVKMAPGLRDGTRTQRHAYLLMEAEMVNVIEFIHRVLSSHLGSLHSCKILHMIESCTYNHIGRWVKLLLKNMKDLKELSLECEFNPCWSVFVKNPIVAQGRPPINFEIFSCLESLELKNYVISYSYSFSGSITLTSLKLQHVWITCRMLEKVITTCLRLKNLSLLGCKKVKNLNVHSPSIEVLELGQMKLHQIDISGSELSVLVFQTMITRPKGLVVQAPKLRVFCCYFDQLIRRRLGFRRVLLTIKQIVTMVKDHMNYSAGYRLYNLFESLGTLSIDLDLNSIKELVFLPMLLRSCPGLQKLEIHNKVALPSIQLTNDNLIKHYHGLMFWEGRGNAPYEKWISEGLKIVVIKGFKGEMVELKFVKYLIAKATMMMESITIWFDDDCSWSAAETAAQTLLLAAAESTYENLSINLKPGNKFLAQVGGSWEDWISYLKQI